LSFLLAAVRDAVSEDRIDGPRRDVSTMYQRLHLERAAVRTEFQKWGNSLALRVPSAFAKEIGAAEEYICPIVNF
jgi:hypothetical protein